MCIGPVYPPLSYRPGDIRLLKYNRPGGSQDRQIIAGLEWWAEKRLENSPSSELYFVR